jgi:uncharacterized repeat protein (TIGR03806 family)
MHRVVLVVVSLVFFLFAGFYQIPRPTIAAPKEYLSEYQFFKGNIADQMPAEGVVPYSLNTPLFSDYSEKLRFIKLPDGQAFVNYNATEVFDFPVGTVIIKTFYYPKDFRKPELGRQLLETRLLLHEADGWKALEYVWNEAQTDAVLEVAGDFKQVAYTDANGKMQQHNYVVPNLNQCKGCHNRNEQMTPIGPSARQLNGQYKQWGQQNSAENQLGSWQKMGILRQLPSLGTVPKMPIWNEPTTGSLNERARAYLDINCAHCHRPEGPASTSGLNLSVHNQDLTTLGFHKAPVAAGRGTGNRPADIVPGKPDQSILLYRMESIDPGIMMPEVGRKRTHQEGVVLVKAWIESLRD